jgi:hypothetical protein
MLRQIRTATESGDKYLPEIKSVLTDEKGETVAVVTRTLYIRLKPTFRPSESNADQ